MTKKINSKRDLPKSFSLEKYDDLENMSDKDLFRQLYWRCDKPKVLQKKELEKTNAAWNEFLQHGFEEKE